MTTILLLASPLVGPATWTPVAEALRRAGREVVVADPREVPEVERPLLVPHSNAGLYAPGLAERLAAAGTVYVDAALPEPGRHDTALCPPAMLEWLRGLADDDGLLPPWSRWWPAEELTGLFPDDATQHAIQAAEPQLPLAYFDSRLAVPSDWERAPSAYLAFGDTYAEEVTLAQQLGWPLEALDGRHLHLLHEPEHVARAVLRLEAALTA